MFNVIGDEVLEYFGGRGLFNSKSTPVVYYKFQVLLPQGRSSKRHSIGNQQENNPRQRLRLRNVRC